MAEQSLKAAPRSLDQALYLIGSSVAGGENPLEITLQHPDPTGAFAEEQDDRIMVMGPQVNDTGRCQLAVGGEEAVFTTTEYKLLCALVESRGRVLTRDHLLRHVWGHHTGTDSRTVNSHITRVRTKLGPCGEYIKTVRGFGYKMEEE